MFKIVREPIAQSCGIFDERAGGYTCFEGKVRNHNEGRRVNLLEYEAYDELADQEGALILEEARQKFDILDATCIHRVGPLQIGDIAIRVEVAAAHRREAFEACEYIVDQVKHRVPIWKKEHYQEGDSGWVNCECCTQVEATSISEVEYYARQQLLPEIGLAGQEKLRNAKVLVVGAGGLGSSALLYLAGAGVGSLGIVDSDEVEASNLHRQVIFETDDIGSSKAECAAKHLKRLNPFIQIQPHPTRLTRSNATNIISDYDLILDCTDTFASKYLLSDAAVLLKKDLIQASIYRYEGQLSVFDSTNSGPCLRCLFPEEPEPECVGSCSEVGVLGVVPGHLGILQATEAVKKILGLASPLNDGSLLVADLLSQQTSLLQRTRNPLCPICGKSPTIKNLEQLDGEVVLENESQLRSYRLVDIRSDQENLSLDAFHCAPNEIRKIADQIDSPALVICEIGVRSERIVAKLRSEGYTQFYWLEGGARRIQKVLG